MKKLYYSIGEVSAMTGIEPHVLRYWETVFPPLRPKKGRSGNRQYVERDLELIMELQVLIHQKGYSTSGALRQITSRDRTSPVSGLEAPKADSSGPLSSSRELDPVIRRELAEIRQLLASIGDRL